MKITDRQLLMGGRRESVMGDTRRNSERSSRRDRGRDRRDQERSRNEEGYLKGVVDGHTRHDGHPPPPSSVIIITSSVLPQTQAYTHTLVTVQPHTSAQAHHTPQPLPPGQSGQRAQEGEHEGAYREDGSGGGIE